MGRVGSLKPHGHGAAACLGWLPTSLRTPRAGPATPCARPCRTRAGQPLVALHTGYDRNHWPRGSQHGHHVHTSTRCMLALPTQGGAVPPPAGGRRTRWVGVEDSGARPRAVSSVSPPAINAAALAGRVRSGGSRSPPSPPSRSMDRLDVA